jgi:hypothetical protein
MTFAERLKPEFVHLVYETQGVKPDVPAIPPPGIYWLRACRPSMYWIDANGVRLEHPAHNHVWSVWTWDLRVDEDWFLAETDEEGNWMAIGNDCDQPWTTEHSMVFAVGPKVDPPKEA